MRGSKTKLDKKINYRYNMAIYEEGKDFKMKIYKAIVSVLVLSMVLSGCSQSESGNSSEATTLVETQSGEMTSVTTESETTEAETYSEETVEVTSEVSSETTASEESAEKTIAADSLTMTEISDLDAQLQLIADNYDNWSTLEFENYSFAVCDLNHNGRLELIVSLCEGSGVFSDTMYYEVNEDKTSLNMILPNRDYPTSSADWLMYEDSTIYEVYMRDGVYYYLVQDFASSGWEYKGVVDNLITINDTEIVEIELCSAVGIVALNEDNEYENLTYTLTDSEDRLISSIEEYEAYREDFLSDYTRLPNCSLGWLPMPTDADCVDELRNSYLQITSDLGMDDVLLHPEALNVFLIEDVQFES